MATTTTKTTPAEKARLRREVEKQRRWIEEHGGDRAGYVQKYGDHGHRIYDADMAALRTVQQQAGMPLTPREFHPVERAALDVDSAVRSIEYDVLAIVQDARQMAERLRRAAAEIESGIERAAIMTGRYLGEGNVPVGEVYAHTAQNLSWALDQTVQTASHTMPDAVRLMARAAELTSHARAYDAATADFDRVAEAQGGGAGLTASLQPMRRI